MSLHFDTMGIRVLVSFTALVAAACSAGPGEGTEACTAPPVDTESAAAPGAEPQAVWSNSVWSNGIWQNGLWGNGAWSNGAWSNGIWQNGRWQNGRWSNGFSAQGFSAQGFSAQGLRLKGSALEAVSTEGVLMAGADVVGAELVLIDGTHLTIASYAADEADSDIAWYTLTYQGQNICGEDTRGTFVPGVWTPEGARLTPEEVPEGAAPFTFSCTTGVIAKCVTWGYKPWLSSEASDMHQTCTRLARADYCGNGVAHTENGTRIDVLDVEGIQLQASKPGEMTFEAAWGPDGAVCVNQTRYADKVVEQGAILPSCWSDKPRCQSLEEGAELGGTMANLSLQGERTFCEPPASY